MFKIYNNHTGRRGFTLIELMTVIAIVGILMALALTAFQGARKSARDGKRKTDLETIRTALEMFKADNGQYPPLDGGTWCYQISNTAFPEVKNALESGYISSIPQDPIYGVTYQDYLYRRISDTQYALYAELETSDVDDDFSGCVRIGNGDNEYDYKVSNP